MVTSKSEGSNECPCVDVSSNLLALKECVVEEKNGTAYSGYLSASGFCISPNYGASNCIVHDVDLDPNCFPSNNVPKYCSNEWCFVDKDVCKSSPEFLYSSDYLPGLFYSYSTCNSTADDWFKFQTTSAIEGRNITAIVPAIWYPGHYKNYNNGTPIKNDDAPEYRNSSVPWTGWVIDYLDAVYDYAKTYDIIKLGNLEYTTLSGGSLEKYGSAWTATVYDVSVGLADMGGTAAWITSQRLKMAPFSTTYYLDKNYLWVPIRSNNDFAYNMKKFMLPFDFNLWLLILGGIIVTTLMRIMLATSGQSHILDEGHLRRGPMVKRTFKKPPIVFLGTATDFFTQSTSHKVASSAEVMLKFAFSFFSLVAIAIYTANLAAFLANSGQRNYIDSIEKALANPKIRICALPGIETDLKNSYPGKNFVFEHKFVFEHEYPDSNLGILESFGMKKCEVIVLSEIDLDDKGIFDRLCDYNLVNTKSLVIEKDIAFPVSKDLVGGLSWLMTRAKDAYITPKRFKDKYAVEPRCNNKSYDRQQRLSPASMSFPAMVLAACCILVIFMHIIRLVKIKRNKKAMKNIEEEDRNLRDVTIDNVDEIIDSKFWPLVHKLEEHQKQQMNFMTEMLGSDNLKNK